jgi:predicted  nucleic acid-binding Zn-ribbon protein
MDEKQIRKHLEELHGEIEHTENVDERERDLLRDLKNDIRELLERSDSGGRVQAEPATLERLEEAIATLEASHPDLTNMLSQALNTLSNAGI